MAEFGSKQVMVTFSIGTRFSKPLENQGSPIFRQSHQGGQCHKSTEMMQTGFVASDRQLVSASSPLFTELRSILSLSGWDANGSPNGARSKRSPGSGPLVGDFHRHDLPARPYCLSKSLPTGRGVRVTMLRCHNCCWKGAVDSTPFLVFLTGLAVQKPCEKRCETLVFLCDGIMRWILKWAPDSLPNQ